MDFLIKALASASWARLIASDTITQVPRDKVVDSHQTPRKFIDLLTCPWCLGFWTSAITLLIERVPGGNFLNQAMAARYLSSVIRQLCEADDLYYFSTTPSHLRGPMDDADKTLWTLSAEHHAIMRNNKGMTLRQADRLEELSKLIHRLRNLSDPSQVL